MAMLRTILSSNVAALLTLVVLFASSAHALDILNKHSSPLTVFIPPICEPCKCPQIQCIRAPCPQPECFCTQECKFVPGVQVNVGVKVTLKVDAQYFPLLFLTVEVEGLVYVVRAVDLKIIVQIATVVVTEKTCEKTGIVAVVYPNPKNTQVKRICLVPGERYGT